MSTAPTSNRSTTLRAAIAAGVLAIAALAFGAGAQPAKAGSYTVAQCFVDGSGYQAAADAYGITNTTVLGYGGDCVSGAASMGLWVYTGPGGSGATCCAGTYGAYRWSAPTGAVIQSVTFDLKGTNHAGWVGFATLDPGAGTEHPIGGNAWDTRSFPPTSASSFTAQLVCGGASGCPGSDQANFHVRNLLFTISDVSGPSVSSLGGELLGGGPRRGTEQLTVGATDAGSGLRSVAVSANGVPVASAGGSCPGLTGGYALIFAPCTRSKSWALPINTELLPNGQNTLEVCVADWSASGAPNRGCATRSIVVDNGCPNSGGSPAQAIDAGLQLGAGQVRSELRTRSDKAITVRGTLTGSPTAPGSTVCLYEQVDLPGDARELVDTAKVQSDGSFALAVAPGPSRSFDVAYRNNNKLVQGAQLRLDSVVRPTFKVKGRKKLRNGQKVRFKGQVPGPNQDGRAIALQAKVGKKWRTFKVVKANAKGKFRGLYRFVSTSRTTRYVFRARVKRQGNYPYLPGSSRKRKIVVRP